MSFERDFRTFELGDNVATLAGGLVLEMAEVFGVPISDKPTPEELGVLIGQIGKNEVLQQNIGQVQEKLGTDSDAVTIAADWLERSGVQLALDRSLWTPNPANHKEITIISGAVANWQDRVTSLVTPEVKGGSVFIPVGNRVMDSATEKVNPNVDWFFETEDKYPTETDYVRAFVEPYLSAVGAKVVINAYQTGNGDEIAARFVRDHERLFNQPIRFARVANAGILLAGQFVRAARSAGIAFDTERSKPQAYVLTDTFPIARTPEELADPRHFQNPSTGIRQIAVTARELASLTT